MNSRRRYLLNSLKSVSVPEVDPVIYIASQEEELKIGEFYDAKIVDCSDDYDMTAVTI